MRKRVLITRNGKTKAYVGELYMHDKFSNAVLEHEKGTEKLSDVVLESISGHHITITGYNAKLKKETWSLVEVERMASDGY